MAAEKNHWEKPVVKIYIGNHLKYKMARVEFFESATYYIRRSFPFAGKSRIEFKVANDTMSVTILPAGTPSLTSLAVSGKGNFLRANSVSLASCPGLTTGYFYLGDPKKSKYGTPRYNLIKFKDL